MAIAFDAQSQGTAVATSLTIAHTCTGSNRVLVLGMMNNLSTDFNPTCTYNGVSATQANEQTNASANQHGYIFVLDDPATGANNVVWTPSSSANMTASHASYTGAHAPSNVPDANDKKSEAAVTSSTLAVVTTVNNCWMVSFAFGAGDQPIAGTGVTSRGGEPNTIIGDSNAAISPAGSYSTTWTRPVGLTISQHNVALAPVSSTTTLDLSENMSNSIIERFTRAWTAPRSRSEVLLLGESTTRTWNAPRSPIDVITITEYTNSLKGRIIELLETMGILDSVSRTVTWTRNFTETISILDLLIRVTEIVITELVAISDSVVRTWSLARAFLDTVSILDVVRTPLNWLKRTVPTTIWTKRTKP